MEQTLDLPETMQTDAIYPPASAAPTGPDLPSVCVTIYDQVYHLRGVDPAYIEHLATLVNEKMRAVSAQGGTVDSLRVAVLAALNIADELNTLRQQYADLAGSHQTSENTIRSRAYSLSGMLDEVLSDRRAG